MNTRLRKIIHLLGWLFLILAALLTIPLVFSLVTKASKQVIQSFLYTLFIAFIVGTLCILQKPEKNTPLKLSGGMILCALAWIFVSLIGGLPFLFGINARFVDSFFESVSGFTTTGITVFTGLDTMPTPILLWRGLIQWVGGLGILTFFLFVTFQNEGDIWQLFAAESHKISTSRPVPNIFRTIKIFWGIYALFSLIQFILLKSLGMPVFDALIHSLTALSTGGFSNHDASIGFYALQGYKNARLIEYTIIFFMALGGMNFLMHYYWLTRQFSLFTSDEETRGYLKIILLFTTLILISIYVAQSGGPDFEINLRTSLFQVVSLITSTGYGTADIGGAFFPPVAKQLFIVLMVIGGCVGSTAGGIKIVRTLIISKLYKREVRKVYYPRGATVPVILNGTPIENNEVLKIAGLLYIWIVLILIGALITAFFSDLSAFEAISGMASAVGNMGPFYFSVEKMSTLSPIIKYTYIFGMLAGRLEMLPMFVLFQRKAWRSLSR
ncbi:TrkH family potassium uptake protein [Fusibacter sp. JL216-2]|uniref:TrkH family potassium uptake protein n=1 Tax=Fusibacter sp. JL216-2 TaxID=3071453 RepID=UPI003D339DBF